MRVAVILATYNAPEWLEKVLCGYGCQTWRPFEVIVADDGSDERTRQQIDASRTETGLPIKHVWHEDRGFRKSRILNRATAESTADYLIYSDGDCIPRADFVACHVEHALPGLFLSGGCVRLSATVSEALRCADIEHGRAFEPRWLRTLDPSPARGLGKLGVSRFRARLLNRLTTTRATWNGHNASGWKQDILAVNGFDERMKYGGQDRELGERLCNLGLRTRQIRYSALCLHLEHARPYVDHDRVARNRDLRAKTRRTRRSWTRYGILKGQRSATP